ncbi:MAG: beta-lactamase family protein, partial [Planctomycetes bacterium]|nr:beta-lactamase family protein [Planctomycetota bacterium]
ESDQRNTGTLAETAERLAGTELAFEPGSKWLYGPGLSVAGRVLEVATGMPYDQFLAERIQKPLGMSETTFRLNDDLKKKLASLYQPTADKKDIEPVIISCLTTRPVTSRILQADFSPRLSIW